MRVLLDECVDWRLAHDILGHDVKTVRQMGWTGMTNGELLERASKSFDVFVTIDQNVAYQQSLRALEIAVIILRARTSRLADLRPLASRLVAAIEMARPGIPTLIDRP